MGHTRGLGDPVQRHRRLLDVIEGLVALVVLCCALVGGTALVTVVLVRVMAHVLHTG